MSGNCWVRRSSVNRFSAHHWAALTSASRSALWVSAPAALMPAPKAIATMTRATSTSISVKPRGRPAGPARRRAGARSVRIVGRIAGAPALQAERAVVGAGDGHGDLQRFTRGHDVQRRVGNRHRGLVAAQAGHGRVGHVADAVHREAGIVVDVIEIADRSVAGLARLRAQGLGRRAAGSAGGHRVVRVQIGVAPGEGHQLDLAQQRLGDGELLAADQRVDAGPGGGGEDHQHRAQRDADDDDEEQQFDQRQAARALTGTQGRHARDANRPRHRSSLRAWRTSARCRPRCGRPGCSCRRRP
mmetsp:Transcript_53126/g.124256  ORF Transcript_53126/g.124256 Transcript_53126/m.124256 type:complete len:301 (-) Transcript_53126:1473-2375(-)